MEGLHLFQARRECSEEYSSWLSLSLPDVLSLADHFLRDSISRYFCLKHISSFHVVAAHQSQASVSLVLALMLSLFLILLIQRSLGDYKFNL